MNSFSFSSPYYFLLLIPLAFSFFKSLKSQRRGSLIFSDLKSIETSLHSLRTQPKRGFPLSASQSLACLRHLCLFSLILALARPQVVHYQGKTNTKGIDIILALDLSSSMLALDFSQSKQIMTRVEAVKSVLQEFIARRPEDAIGLIAFAGNPYLVSPLTLNHDWLVQNLNRCNIGLIEDGTAIGSAIIMAINRLKDQKNSKYISPAAIDTRSDTAPTPQAPGQVLILLTDGVNNKGEVSPSLAAEIALTQGIKIYTIGVGEGGIVPTLLLDDKGDILKNAWGQLQIAQAQIPIDETTLKYIAEKTGGRFFQAKDKRQLASIYEAIDTIEKRDLPLNYPQHIQEYFFLALGLALLFFVLEWALAHTRLQILP
jgi:Ca-activated chloride channel homolog